MIRPKWTCSAVFAASLAYGCSSGMTQQEIDDAVAVRDARCQSLKRQIDEARGQPLRRDYLLRQYDQDCRRP